jgi:hypothetical protein
MDHAADAEVTRHLCDPPNQPFGIRARLPEVVDVGVKELFHADGTALGV